MEYAITAQNLSISFREKQILKDITLNIQAGEIFGLLGPSGAGKTTLIKLLTGQLRQDSGFARLLGTDTRKLCAREHRQIGIMMDTLGLYERLSAYDNLSFYADIYHVPRRKIADILKDIGLYEARNTAVSKLSKGMKNRLSLARALINDAKILFLDEPTSGLDPLMQSRFIRLIAEEKEHGKTVLMSSHMFEEVERTCDRIGIIQKGRMITVESAAALHERHTRSYTVALENETDAKAFAADFDGIQNGTNVTVTTKQSLEEIFMNYYGGNKND